MSFRSSLPEVFCKRGVLRNFKKLTGKHLHQSLFFNKVEKALLKKRLWHRCFPVNFVKFPRTPFFIEHLWLLLLELGMIHKNTFINNPNQITFTDKCAKMIQNIVEVFPSFYFPLFIIILKH